MELLVQYTPAILFYAFAALTLASGLMVVSMRNPVYSAIALLSSFLGVAGLFLLLRAEFLFAVQIFVYGGGVMVLFLFVIMLVNLHQLHERRMFAKQLPLAALLVLMMIVVVGVAFAGIDIEPVAGAATALASIDGEPTGNAEALAWTLYRHYPIPFEVASIFLLVAMIGAVVLGRRN